MLRRVAVARVSAGLLAANQVERHLRERLQHPADLLHARRRRIVRVEACLHAVGVSFRLHLVVLQRVEYLGIVGRGDHPVEHAENVLLHRIRLVDVLDQLRFQLTHVVQPPHPKLPVFHAGDRRVTEVPAVLRFEPVNEGVERGFVVELEAPHLERHAR